MEKTGKKMNQREFLYLCARGDYDEIEAAIENGASVNRRAKFQGASVPPLFVAVMEKNPDAIETLLAYHAKDFPAFMAAMIMEDKKMLEYLVCICADINCKDQNKRTPLLCAVMANKSKIVKWLVELGADVNMPVGLGYSVLTYAALMYDEENNEQPDPEIIKILMNAGADYREAMLTAIKTNNVDFARLLIQNGADINKPYTMNQSPLSLAILNIQYSRDKALPMIEFFIEQGANVNEILDLSHDDDINEDNPPIFTTNINVAISMESDKCLELLLKNGANSNFIDSKGRTPLMYAVLTGLSTVEILLNYGADPNLGDLEGRTPLTLAVIDSDVEEGVIKTLLEHGANPNIRDNSGFTPLTWAVNDRDRSPEFFIAALIRTGAIRAEKGAEWYGLAILFNALRREMQLDTIQLLVNYGADVTIPDKKGVTALAWAIMNFDDEITDILQKAAESKTNKNQE
ncbi:MAG: ankyrin repeat domain-containing protein [Synergistaceae bacterium]|nr:ankyrin repeat domain-containing protein [Synergistaceae bacterium]